MPRQRRAPADVAELVTKIAFSKRAGGELTFHLANGGMVTTSNEAFRYALADLPRHVVPASPGTYVLHDALRNGQVHVRKTAVVGWMVDALGDAFPLTATSCGVPRDYTPTILHPDGSVDHILSHHESYDDWLADLHEQRRAELVSQQSRGGA